MEIRGGKGIESGIKLPAIPAIGWPHGARHDAFYRRRMQSVDAA
jgi:hypothetical protein